MTRAWDKSRMPSRHVTVARPSAAPVGAHAVGNMSDADFCPVSRPISISQAEMAERREAWQPRRTDHNRGAIRKYARRIGPARLGALTHTGAAAASRCHADI
jgi:dihydroxy-acid dehydratase